MPNTLTTHSCFPRAFNTGDVGFVCPKSGDLYVIGRVDDVVKVNGVKIWVGAIDQLLASLRREDSAFAGLGTTSTLALQKGEAGTRLVCFYQRDNELSNSFTSAQLSEVVRNHFSAFLNVTFVEVASFPIQKHSGKIDKVKLKQDFQQGLYDNIMPHKRREFEVTPRTVVGPRETVRRIFAKHLGLSEAAQDNGEPSDDQDFFLIGGDSITVVVIVADLRKQGFKVKLNDFVEKKKIGEFLDTIMKRGPQLNLEESTVRHEKQPFVREYLPGKTFINQPLHDARCKEAIAQVIVESFVHFEPLVQLVNLSEETLHKIVRSRLAQFEHLPGLVKVAGYTEGDPSGPLEALISDISAVTIGCPASNPPAPDVEDPIYYHLEKAFESCFAAAGEIEDFDKCFTSLLVGASRDTTDAGERLRLLFLLEEALIDGSRKMGFTRILSVNTTAVTQMMAVELGYVQNCIVNIASILEARGVKCTQESLLCQVATLRIDKPA